MFSGLVKGHTQKQVIKKCFVLIARTCFGLQQKVLKLLFDHQDIILMNLSIKPIMEGLSHLILLMMKHRLMY
ncbi:hypothetical protein AWV58_14110 [Klebsiella quasipneumoniae]|nr:hypothetical protein AWV58_14110 [Klebsiella quasipneumoniae]ASR27340.1 hypothetical protein AWV59_17745 [Klebsiella quasipneumoniae]ASR30285.1 hypothetical protein AWV60_07720 [Klebsiella quasipneumoniae]